MRNPWKPIHDGKEPPFAPFSVEYLYPGLVSLFPYLTFSNEPFVITLGDGKPWPVEGGLTREDPVAWRKIELCSPHQPICCYP